MKLPTVLLVLILATVSHAQSSTSTESKPPPADKPGLTTPDQIKELMAARCSATDFTISEPKVEGEFRSRIVSFVKYPGIIIRFLYQEEGGPPILYYITNSRKIEPNEPWDKAAIAEQNLRQNLKKRNLTADMEIEQPRYIKGFWRNMVSVGRAIGTDQLFTFFDDGSILWFGADY